MRYIHNACGMDAYRNKVLGAKGGNITAEWGSGSKKTGNKFRGLLDTLKLQAHTYITYRRCACRSSVRCKALMLNDVYGNLTNRGLYCACHLPFKFSRIVRKQNEQEAFNKFLFI